MRIHHFIRSHLFHFEKHLNHITIIQLLFIAISILLLLILQNLYIVRLFLCKLFKWFKIIQIFIYSTFSCKFLKGKKWLDPRQKLPNHNLYSHMIALHLRFVGVWKKICKDVFCLATWTVKYGYEPFNHLNGY